MLSSKQCCFTFSISPINTRRTSATSKLSCWLFVNKPNYKKVFPVGHWKAPCSVCYKLLHQISNTEMHDAVVEKEFGEVALRVDAHSLVPVESFNPR